MADISVYPRKRSPFFYISYLCPTRLRRTHQATPFRTDDPRGERLAYELARERSAGAEIFARGAKRERFDTWVPSWLQITYRNAKTRLRYSGAWAQWRLFLRTSARIDVPRALTYQHVLDFHAWRTAQRKRSGRTVGSNTAISDIKFMQACISEAMRRGFATANPCQKLAIQRDPVRRAHALTAEELALIERTLPAYIAADPVRRGWMLPAYTIARFQGCRLRETRLHLRSQVDLRAGQITFIAKGSAGRPNEFVTMIHARVRPLLEQLLAAKATHTLEFPPCPSVYWRKFFDHGGLPHVWFHCLRSTVATELALAGVPISLAMRYQGHAKEEIHRAYQDIKARDLTVCAAAVGQAPAHTPPTP